MSKTIILSSLLALGISGIGGIASADEGIINGGSENVNNYNGLVRSEVSEQNVTKDGTTLKSIETGPISGGYWIRGTNSYYVISKYKHYKRSGKASVVNKYGEFRNGGWKRPDVFSSAKVRKTFGGNKAYYNHK
ncbi:lactococcin 972 family bacteriocin [Staphylococcus rostri]|uniref:Lactococcin 972 family bacteriocin n=1 Tax=Staphylococcus rostri TaxID=522262 RepID=A0A2K3YEQ9_9STAP|nr:lactococcin 972 family bacteriocin [Staphylococcus rostri]PNZ24103.1 hypothetical protein CD122_11675 [Staphylococcus rostri]